MATKEKNTINIVVVCLATVSLLAILVYWLAAMRTNRTNTYNSLSDANKEIISKYDLILEGRFDVIDTFALTLAKQGLSTVTEGQLLERLETLQGNNQHARMVGVGNADGLLLLNSGDKINVAERSYFSEVMSGKKGVTYLGNNLLESDHAIIVCTSPIVEDGTVTGFVMSSVTADSMSQYLYCQEYGSNSTGMLLTDTGTILIHEKEKTEDVAGKTLNNLFNGAHFLDGNKIETIRDDFANHETGSLRFRMDGSTYYVGYTYVGAENWMLLTLVPQSTAEAHARSSIGGTWAVFVLVFSSAVASIVLLLRSERKQIKHEENEKMQLAMSQIKPHFIYNTLTTIQALCYIDPEQAADTVVLFSKYLRSVFNVTHSVDVAPFSAEVEKASDYMKLEQLRFGEKLKYETDIQVSDFLIPVLGIQPLVSNAIKHGLAKRAEYGTVKITSELSGGNVIIKVSDDGVGYDPNTAEEKTLAGLKRRFDVLVGGKFTIDSTVGKGTTVIISLPYKREKDESSID